MNLGNAKCYGKGFIEDFAEAQHIINTLIDIENESAYCEVLPVSNKMNDHYMAIKIDNKIILTPKFYVIES